MQKVGDVTVNELVGAFKKAGFITKEDIKDFPTRKEVKKIVKDEVHDAVKQEIAISDLATKKDVKDIIHNELTEFHSNITIPELKKLNDKIDGVEKSLSGKIGDLELKVDKLQVDMRFVKEEVKTLNADVTVASFRN